MEDLWQNQAPSNSSPKTRGSSHSRAGEIVFPKSNPRSSSNTDVWSEFDRQSEQLAMVENTVGDAMGSVGFGNVDQNEVDDLLEFAQDEITAEMPTPPLRRWQRYM